MEYTFKVGEYIRTPYNTIEQITKIDESDIRYTAVMTDKCCYNLTFLNKCKHSFDIIDLIKCGDFVNNHLVTATYLDGARKYIKLDNAYYDEINKGIRTYNKDIKTVVTAEKFSNIIYVVGDKNE